MRKLLILIACLACIAAVARSPQWHGVRDKAVLAHPYCALCGAEDSLEAHHIKPFRVDPTLELATNNIAILCRHCHYQLGHGGIAWDYENTNIMSILNYDTGGQLYRQRMEYRRIKQ
jgi:hypothetical protein